MEPLMSQRYVRSHFHPRRSEVLEESDLLRGLTLHESAISSNDRVRVRNNIPSRPFRLLALPLEIQNLIYTHYFGRWSVTLDYERYSMLRSRLEVRDVPSMKILRVSRHVSRTADEIRMRCFTGRLFLNSVFVLVSLRKKTGFEWLKRHVRILHFSDSSVRPERWYRYYESFVGLERLEIDFPRLIKIGAEADCLDLESVLSGERDDVLLTANLEDFRTSLIGELGRSLMVVISQTYCLNELLMGEGWRGVLVRFVILWLPFTYSWLTLRTQSM